jgi:hypothetical protein
MDNAIKILLRIIPLGCFIAAVIATVLCVWTVRRENNFLHTAATAEGTVVALTQHGNSDGTMEFAPVFTYSGSAGQTYTVTSATSSYPPAYAVGQRVPVSYTPGSPASAEIVGFWNEWLATVVTGVFAGAFLLAAVFFWVLQFFVTRHFAKKAAATA